jgi:hypothetical protein
MFLSEKKEAVKNEWKERWWQWWYFWEFYNAWIEKKGQMSNSCSRNGCWRNNEAEKKENFFISIWII